MFRRNHPIYLGSCWLLLVAVPISLGNPENPEIRHGAAEFLDLDPGELTIDQFSDRLIVDWERFSISSGEVTRFNQPNANSAALNRVFSGDPSSIHGRLEANGHIWLINPNGVLIGPGGSVKANGFIASTLDVDDGAFLSGGEARFTGGSQAKVENLGSIEALGGDVFLIAREVRNSGSITAREGTVGLAAGSEVVIAPAGEERIAIVPNGEGSVENSGTIEAATAELKAAGGNAYALAINNSGLVRANGFQRRGGRLYLSAGGRGKIVNTGRLESRGGEVRIQTQGEVEVSGDVDASSDSEAGGKIVIDASQVRILGPPVLDASGTEGGEVALSGSESVHVDGAVKANGNAGNGGVVTMQAPDISLGENANIRADGSLSGGLVLAGVDPRAPAAGVPEATSVRAAAGSRISANGGAGDGGDVLIFGSQDGEMRLGGSIRANSASAAAGDILVLGGDVFVTQTADFRANGETHGGTIQVEGEGNVRVAGRLEARGVTGDGGFIHVKGENVAITQTATINASGGRDGGFVHLEGGEDGRVEVAGTVLAKGGDGDGGMIQLTGGQIVVAQSGLLDASGGADGGFILIEGGESVEFAGTARAVGGSGDGGMIQITGKTVAVTSTGVLDASGARDGGFIHVEGSESVRFDGSAFATGGSGAGGRVTITGEEVSLGATALVDASGATVGGQILIGGGRQGRDPGVRNARNTTIARGARLIANGGEQGGEVIVWADGVTSFEGRIEAKQSGPDFSPGIQRTEVRSTLGGFAEVSGLQQLMFHGEVDTGGGQLLLDPFNYNIGFAEANAIVAALGANNVTIDTTANVAAFGSSGNPADPGVINVNDAIFWNSPNSLTLLATGGVNVNSSIQNANAAGGDLNIVAGWDGVTAFSPGVFGAADLATTTLFANGGASVNIGDGNQPDTVAVGSRSGATRIFTHDLTLQGGNAVGIAPGAQVGFLASNQGAGFAVTGDISIRATGAIAANAGAAFGSYAQLGHIGRDVVADPAVDASVNAAIAIEALENIDLTANNAAGERYAQLGHGGIDTAGTFDGAISILQADTVTVAGANAAGSYALIGPGGLRTTGSANAPITISGTQNLSVTADAAAGAFGAVGAYFESAPAVPLGSPPPRDRGTIDITLGDGLIVAGQNFTNQFAGIGHGDALGDVDTGREVAGDINLRVGGNANLFQGSIGHRIDPTGAYVSGNTLIGVGQNDFTPADLGTLQLAGGSRARSAPFGELRLYIPQNAGYIALGAPTLNGNPAPATGTDPLPNQQLPALFGAGAYAPPFSFYLAPAGGGAPIPVGGGDPEPDLNPLAGILRDFAVEGEGQGGIAIPAEMEPPTPDPQGPNLFKTGELAQLIRDLTAQLQYEQTANLVRGRFHANREAEIGAGRDANSGENVAEPGDASIEGETGANRNSIGRFRVEAPEGEAERIGLVEFRSDEGGKVTLVPADGGNPGEFEGRFHFTNGEVVFSSPNFPQQGDGANGAIMLRPRVLRAFGRDVGVAIPEDRPNRIQSLGSF